MGETRKKLGGAELGVIDFTINYIDYCLAITNYQLTITKKIILLTLSYICEKDYKKRFILWMVIRAGKLA